MKIYQVTKTSSIPEHGGSCKFWCIQSDYDEKPFPAFYQLDDAEHWISSQVFPASFTIREVDLE